MSMIIHRDINDILRPEHNNTEVDTEVVPWKKVFLKTSQYSQENTCVEVSF